MNREFSFVLLERWQVFNNSPDETAYFRMLLNRENISNATVMIQPSLTSYTFSSPPQPALLDVASIAADRILLLDAYFSVVVFHGMTIAQWRNMGYHEQPEHEVTHFELVIVCLVAKAFIIQNHLFHTCVVYQLYVPKPPLLFLSGLCSAIASSPRGFPDDSPGAFPCPEISCV